MKLAPPPTALTALARAQRAGVRLKLNGERLAFDAPAGAMTAELRALLLICKEELLAVLNGDYRSAAAALLTGLHDAAERDALRCQFDERAAICQYDGNLSENAAERQAHFELTSVVEALSDEPPAVVEALRQLRAHVCTWSAHRRFSFGERIDRHQAAGADAIDAEALAYSEMRNTE
jgi:hypothetical protein